uniref:DNA cytosine methyltransferase n=1 Tax=uncultured Campylobacter sp. TaxID=218934 RepID=UPI002621E45A
MTLATLFSGIGAAEFAAREVFNDANVVFACEIDKFARQSYLANHEAPAVFYEDVCNLDARAYAGQIDILVGGSPCQDFSIAGQRAGENGERGNLIWQFYRVVSEARPSIFVYENVKGFLSIDSGKSYQRFLDALRGMGYHCHAEILNTKDYGIPQNRERLYIVGFLNSDEYHAFSLAPKTGCGRLADFLDTSIEGKYFLSDRALAHFRSKNPKFNGEFHPKDANENIANTLATNPGHRRTDTFIRAAGELDAKGNERIRKLTPR